MNLSYFPRRVPAARRTGNATFRTGVPPAVPNTPLQDDRLAWPGVARLLTGKLKPKPARHNGHALFLKMMQMHRRTDTRRSKELAFHAIDVSITNDAEKGEYLAFAVLDLVRICVHQVPSILPLEKPPGSLAISVRSQQEAPRAGASSCGRNTLHRAAAIRRPLHRDVTGR
jgi:hypothetical protein